MPKLSPAAVVASLSLLMITLAPPLRAETYFVAPPGTALSNASDGSRARPWTSLPEALASGQVTGGDELRLLPGRYGTVTIARATFSSPVTITADSAGTAHLEGLSVQRSRNLLFRDLAVWPLGPGKGPLVTSDSRSPGIVFQGFDIRGRADAESYPSWTKDDWLAARRGGIRIEGPENAILDSRFTGTAFAIGATGPQNRIEGNLVRGFSGDGARVLGDGSVFHNNRIEDCVQVDNNHADGFQSWSRGPDGKSGRGTVHGLRIEANVILEWANPQLSPLRCSLQGIGMFDGMYEDVLILNNLIAVSAPHGITVAGGRRVQILHNTVINNRAPHRKYPWIRLPPHKNDTPAEDGLIANNIATVLQYDRDPRFRIMASGNLTGMAPARIFMDPAKGDLRPRPGGPAEGRGDPAHSLPRDLFGQPRDEKPDIGAIEYR